MESSGSNLPSFLDIPEVPDLETTLISSAEQEICGRPTPADDIDVAIVGRVDSACTLATLGSNIPDHHTLVCRTRRKYGKIGGAPLQIFHTRCMGNKRLRIGAEPRG